MSMDRLLIIQAAAAANTVLSGKGIHMPVPIFLNVSCPIAEIVKALEISSLRVLTALDKKDDIASELVKPGVDPFVFIYDGSFKGTSRLELIINSVKAGQCYAKKITRLPIVVSDFVVPRELQEDVFELHLEKCESEKVALWELLADGKQMPLVERKISEVAGHLPAAHQFFLSALAFLYPKLQESGRLNEYAEFETVIADMVEKDLQAKDSGGISEMFLRKLYGFNKDGERPKIATLPEVKDDALKNPDDFFFCSYEFVHMTDNLFKEIVGNMSKILGINTIKNILAEEGFIVKVSKRSYLSKVTVTTKHGDPLRLDVLKFDMKKITRLGKTDFFVEFGG
ncbi:MAG: hypothetical protein ACI4LO_08075 [Anaerovoracaceae bacterium]